MTLSHYSARPADLALAGECINPACRLSAIANNASTLLACVGMLGYEPDFYKLPKASRQVRMSINSYRALPGKDMLSAFYEPGFFNGRHSCAHPHIQFQRFLLVLPKADPEKMDSLKERR